jgi:2-hydroxy-3-keto-5-methylthiopentenyl-1-phosphate phosphatase
VWLASGGFDFYIEALLGPRLGVFERRYFNATRFIEGRIEVDFPHAELACGRCAVCKGKVCDLARATGRPTLFIGDGASDRCAIGRADTIFAVRGSLLERVCAERGAECQTFESFEEIAGTLTAA